MAIKTMDDIEREKHNEGRIKMRKEVTEDANEILGGIFGKPKTQKRSFWGIFLKILLFILAGVVVINLVLGNIWLLRFFLKSLFGIG